MQQNGKITKGLLWNMAERFGVLGTRFILQLILARMLAPEHYGALSLMVIFTTLANVLVQQGFNTALIQSKEVTENDYSSVLWVNVAIAAVLYAVLYLCAPIIAEIYKMENFVVPFRVILLVLFPGAVHSVQLAIIGRELEFKKFFYSNMVGVILSGIAGIVVAWLDGGIWALVWQMLLHMVIVCVAMQILLKWKIRFVCDLARVKVFFSYGWKILASSLLDTLYQDLRGLVTGLKYDSNTLAYYNRGKQFPQFLITVVNNTVHRVMLPVMSAQQDHLQTVKKMTRNSMMLSSYIVFPVMAGLAGVATPLIHLILTDKWLPAVPYMQIYCFALALNPVQSCSLQAINAIGRSDVNLKLEVINKTVGITALVIAVFLFDSPIAIAMTGVITAIASCFINAVPNKRLIGYGYWEQVKDMLPSLLVSVCMFLAVLLVGTLPLPSFVLLIAQIFCGVAVYILLSAVFRLKPFGILVRMLFGKKKEP